METKKKGIELLDKNQIRLSIEIYGGGVYELKDVFEYDENLKEYCKSDLPIDESSPPWDRHEKISITFNNHFREGIYKEYFKSNRIKRILPFIYEKEINNFNAHGLEKVYYEGYDDTSQCDVYVISQENNYLEGLRIGLQKQYYTNGNLQLEMMIEQRGDGEYFSVETAYYKKYHLQSLKICEEVYPNWGKKYYESGQLMAEWKSNDYEIIGEYIQKYPSGSVEMKVNYVEGKRDGIMYKYFEDGVFKEVWEYDKGDRKHIKKFFPNGKLKSEWIYANGKVITKKEFKINER